MRKKYLKFLKLFSLVNIILLLLNIFSFFLLTGPGVFQTHAETIAMSQQVRLEAAQCSDGIDNDGDGFIDYPDDPGCSSADDDDESDHPITPPPPEQQQPGGGGGNNPPTQPPVPVQPMPVWLNISLINNQPLENIIKNSFGYYQLTDRLLTFQGQTNIVDAIVFIQLNDQPQVIYTTYIDEFGNWEWVTPYQLNLANYQLYVWAINPHDPSIATYIRLNFQITGTIILPEPITTTTPPVIPPATPPAMPPIVITYPDIVPQEIYNSSKEFYNLNVRVLNDNKQIYATDKLSVKFNIYKLKPDEARDIKINFIIKNNSDKIVMSSEKNLSVNKFLSIIQNFQTSFYLKSGKYKIEVSLNKDNKIFIASDTFRVIERPIFIGGFEFPLTTNELARNLMISFAILFLIFVVFVLLLIYEYHLSRREPHISEEDLGKKDFFDLE